MSFRLVDVPGLGRLSNVMAHPSSGESDSHEAGLDEFFRLGGNCLHLHGEDGEVHSRRAAGRWLDRHRLRSRFFLCTQICHDGWDHQTQRAIDRFSPEAVADDIATDLELLGTNYLDLIYLDDRPQSPQEPVIQAIAREILRGRVRAWGVRNWTPERIHSAAACITREAWPEITAIITTELALPAATGPLWPEYVPFDAGLRQVVATLRLTVFAHAGDLNTGQCLYGDEDTTARARRHWLDRWQHPANPAVVQRVRRFAATHGASPRAVNIAWMLNQPFPSFAVIALPSFLSSQRAEYERASPWRLSAADLDSLCGGPGTTDQPQSSE